LTHVASPFDRPTVSADLNNEHTPTTHEPDPASTHREYTIDVHDARRPANVRPAKHLRLSTDVRRQVDGSRVKAYPVVRFHGDTTPLNARRLATRMTEYTTVSIPKDLGDRVEETIEGTSFSSTSDLVRFLLRSIVIQHQQQGELTEAEFSDIAEQLSDLGYLE
jgi:Arc/MetJ-type ribon-helix-helix transcriptional regulator